MQNVSLSLDGNKLVIEMDISEAGKLSKAGRSFVIASNENPVAFDKLDDFGLPGYMLKVMLIRSKDAEPYSIPTKKKIFKKVG